VFVAADVHYLASGAARAAAVVAADAAFSYLVADRVRLVPYVEPYQPGQFYLRELPPPRTVLGGLTGMALLVVDGYADLDPDGRPGLGARAHAEFAVPVIGVAKSAFRTRPAPRGHAPPCPWPASPAPPGSAPAPGAPAPASTGTGPSPGPAPASPSGPPRPQSSRPVPFSRACPRRPVESDRK
jgi:Endonuclease V